MNNRLANKKQFELKDHLGNVRHRIELAEMAIISDCKNPEKDGAYRQQKTAEIQNICNYYSFGMPMHRRNYTSSLGAYRFGFNGKENDNEVKGDGVQQDYGFRIYDTRICKFLSVDPLTKDYPWYTPYQFAGNKPISFIDRDGLEEARIEEKAWALFNLFDALKVKANSKKAFEAANKSGLPGATDGLQDAFRHAYWNAICARDIGADDTEPFTTLHELGYTNPALDPKSKQYDPIAVKMDLHNNEIGRQIGEANPNATDEEMGQLVIQAMNEGKFLVVKMNSEGQPIDVEGNVITRSQDKVLVSSNSSSSSPAPATTRKSYDRGNTYTDELPKANNSKKTKKNESKSSGTAQPNTSRPKNVSPQP